jgi:hypothetical protein
MSVRPNGPSIAEPAIALSGLGTEMSQVLAADRSSWSIERREGGDRRPAISVNDVARARG